MENNSNNNRTSSNVNSSSTTNSSTTTINSSSMVSSSTPTASSASTSTIRQSHKRTFAESDSSSRTERHLCSFSHLWIINYLSSYIDDSNFTCLQSETFSPVNTPYSNTRWSLKLYPRGLNEKQHTNNNIAIFLKYVSGTMPTIKAKAEFSVVSRNNELVMLRSTNFHTFSSGNDWGYSEFLDGNYLNSRRNDLLTDDRLRVYVRVILVDEKETITGDIFHSSPHYHHHHHHHHASAILPPPLPSHPIQQQQQQQQQQISTIQKTQASTSSSLASSSSTTSIINSNSSNASSTSSPVVSGLFNDDKERFKSLELLSNQIKTLLDDERFTDVHIHVIPKQSQPQEHINDDHRRSNRLKRSLIKQQHPSCSSCHCTAEKTKSIITNNERLFDHHHHEQSSSVISKDSESNNIANDSRLCQTSLTRRATRSTTSLLSRMAQSSSETNHSSSNYSTSLHESSSDICSSSSILSLNPKRCLCICHNQDNNDLDITYDIQQSYIKYSNITPLATFHAHRAILIARSSSFASQIHLNNLNGSNHNFKSPPIDLYIDDLEPSTVRAMLIYIYTGRLPTSNDEIYKNLNPIDLFRAAVKHDLNELRDLAKSAMLDVLKIENSIEMLEVSDQANDIFLKQQVLAFIRSNASAVSKTANWLNFTKYNPHLIIDAFRSLVTPTVTNTTITKHNNNNNSNNNNNNNNNNNLNHYHHSTSLTTTSKYSKYD
ncbi:unnamed protein product [Rotaria sp. Silwood2]|nr:unnamed protein product [Rotaria sp. Silwood2]CAF2564063.1 unnamed protein product [Rotaria sp. Silwood2]CAF2968419.1 unnamed protein product [Rotaria sp. Silwood2]CAF4003024.1 unnamed protein product [Rotaria sp. Silwood2]CAF4099854.1 unnamed protein product [Rotaria sp. Silwood2]